MPRPTIDEITGNINQYATLYRWDVQIIAPSGIASSQELVAKAISSDIPKRTHEEIEVGVHGFKAYQAGIPSYSPITLTFLEDERGYIQNFIQAWSALQWDPKTGVQRPKNQYTAKVILTPLSSSNAIVYTYTLVNAFMQDYNIPTLDGTANDIMKPEITLRFDYFLGGKSARA